MRAKVQYIIPIIGLLAVACQTSDTNTAKKPQASAASAKMASATTEESKTDNPPRIEAEDMTLSGSYGVSSFSFFSNGQAISLPRSQSTSGVTGQASYTFTGAAGIHDLDVGYYKERDGGATIDVAVNGVLQGTIKIYSAGADSRPTTGSFAIKSFSVALNPGDVITLTADGNNWSHAIVDYIDLTES